MEKNISNKYEKSILIFFHLLCFAVITYLLRLHKYDLNQDHAMYLYAGKLISQGKIPFLDFFDINPPWIMYLSALVVELAKKISVNEIYLYKVIVSLIYFSFSYLSTKILSQELRFSLGKKLICTGILFLMMIPLIYTSFWGQRDELFGFATVLYLLLKAVRIKSAAQRDYKIPFNVFEIIWLSVLFGIFICFKPHFFLVLLGCEMFYVYSTKRPRDICSPETIITIIISVLYAVSFVFLPPEALSNFFTKMNDVFHFYDSYNKFRPWPILQMFFLYAPAFLSLIYFFGRWRKTDSTVKIFCMAALIFTLIIILQGRFFAYHFSTLYIIGTYLSIFAVFKQRDGKKDLLNFLRFAPIVLFLFFSIRSGYRYLTETEGYFSFRINLNRTVAHYISEGDPVLTLASTPFLSYPTYNLLNLKNASRYLFQYPLSFFGTRRFNPETKQIDIDLDPQALVKEDQYFTELKEDIDKNKPKIIYYDALLFRQQNFPPGFPLQKYLEMKGLIKYIESDYDHVAKDGFMVYKRRD